MAGNQNLILQTDDKVTNGYEYGVVTGRVSDTEVRVYWHSGSNMYHDTVPVNSLTLVEAIRERDEPTETASDD